MKSKRLTLQCGDDKCQGILIPMFISLEEGYSLRIDGYCYKCGSRFYVSYPLERLITSCPGSSTTPFKPVKPPLKSKEDDDFLKQIGIDPNGK